MMDQINILLVFTAGLTSVMSPCVLPVLPIIVTGTGNDHRLRPLLIIAGLSLTFITMGVLSSLFGAVIGPAMTSVEKVAAVIIIAFGLLLVFNVNLFKHLQFFSQIAGQSRGRWGGFLLGLVLGIIWIPCIGPMLSSVLAMVATHGKIGNGIFLLGIYSIGFSIPLLLAGYAAHLFRARVAALRKFPFLVNLLSGTVLIALGAFILTRGMIGFGGVF